MSGEKRKPFAEVVDHYWHGLPINDRYSVQISGRDIAWNGESTITTTIADHINAAVAQREARLVGALRASAHGTHEGLPCWCWQSPVTNGHADHCLRLRAALEGHGDFVPRAELDTANAVIKQLTAAFDVLDARESLTAREVVAHLEAAGLRTPQPPLLAMPMDGLRALAATDDEGHTHSALADARLIIPISGPVVVEVRRADLSSSYVRRVDHSAQPSPHASGDVPIVDE